MLYSKTEELQDLVIQAVAETRLSIEKLHEQLSKTHKKVSLRAVYKSVRKLVTAGVLLKVGKYIILDQEWVERVREGLPLKTPPLSLGERAEYSFVSLENLDAFWKTVVLPLERIEKSGEMFFYNPHNFWAYLPGRKESETAYYQHFSDTKRHAFFTLGGETEADKEFKRTYQNEYLQIDLRNKALFRKTDHVTIIGNFVITVRLPKKMAEAIEALYTENEGIKDILPKLLSLVERPGKVKFIFENNQNKAKRLRKKLSKNFFIQAALGATLI